MRKTAVLFFSDVVDSVGLQKRIGSGAFADQIARHDQLFYQVVALSEGGQVLQHTGDGFLISFPTASSAVEASLRLQWLFNQEDWPSEAMRLRIGLHLGEVYEMQEQNTSETRPVGMATNLAARIMGMAEANQILMTRAIYDDARQFVRVHPAIPEAEDLKTMELRWLAHGAYEIKGNDEPVEVFEVGVPEIAPLVAPMGSEKTRRVVGEGEMEVGDNPMRSAEEDWLGSDVFIGYAEVDDVPLRTGDEGWIAQLRRNLAVRMEQLSGSPVKVACAGSRSAESEEKAAVLKESLSGAKAMVSVISPPFAKSYGGRRELEYFGVSSGTDDARMRCVVNAIKTPVEVHAIPAPFGGLIQCRPSFEFFERDPASGRVREYHESLGEESRLRYYERVYDLAHELCQAMEASPETGEAAETGRVSGPKVFLATTTSDLSAERDKIRRELQERGFQVVPDGSLPLVAGELEKAIAEQLEGCVTAIHLLGPNYGLIPEGASESMVAIQLRLTAQRSVDSDLKRFVWSPRSLEAADPRQLAFVQEVQEDAGLHRAAELIEGGISTLRKDLIRVLDAQAAAEDASEQEASDRAEGSPPLVYLICEQRDEAEIEGLEDYLFQQGLEVCLPAFDGDEADAKTLHRENLVECDAALVYYGAAPRAWVDIKLRDLIKAPGYGRARPIEAQGVYIVPPEDHRKRRYKTHRSVIRQAGEAFAVTPELTAFVNTVKVGRSA